MHDSQIDSGLCVSRTLYNIHKQAEVSMATMIVILHNGYKYSLSIFACYIIELISFSKL
jgi:hypothetical protein